MRPIVSTVVWITLVVALSMPLPARAAAGVVGDGTPASCTEAAFDAALNDVQDSGGGTLSFNCGGPKTIVFTSSKIITTALTVEGVKHITLSGGNATPLFTVDPSAALTIYQVPLTNGAAADSGRSGGAITNGGMLQVDDSIIQNSTAQFGGGAITTYGAMAITNSVLANNRAASGGAIESYGPRSLAATGKLLGNHTTDAASADQDLPPTTTVIVNSQLRDNHATGTTNQDGRGGAVLVHSGATVTMQGGEIISNTARLGGGMYAVAVSAIAGAALPVTVA